AVGVDDDLAPGEAGVAHGSTNDETSGGIDVVLGIGIEKIGGDDGLDDVLENAGAKFVVADALGMLGRNDDRIHPNWLAMRIVFHGDLRFTIRPQIRELAMLP